MRKLKGKRVENNLTQLDMAKKMDISVKTYNRKEVGESEFNLYEVRKISEILQLSLKEVNNIFFDNKLT